MLMVEQKVTRGVSFEWWSLTRELLKQYLTEKQNGCLRSGRLREVVANEKWSL